MNKVSPLEYDFTPKLIPTAYFHSFINEVMITNIIARKLAKKLGKLLAAK